MSRFRWPLNRQWSAVGRWNYAVPERRSIETFMGIEYEDCCWGIRLVGRRYLTDITGDYQNGVFLQLELKGLSGVGKRTTDFLRQNIRGYEEEFLTEHNPPFCWLFTALLLASSYAYSAPELDRIIAVVNDDVIMHSELETKIRTVLEQMRQAGDNPPPPGHSGKNNYWKVLSSTSCNCNWRITTAFGLMMKH